MDVLTAPAAVGRSHPAGPVERQHTARNLDADHVDIGLQLAIDAEAQTIALPFTDIPFAGLELGVTVAEFVDVAQACQGLGTDAGIGADPFLAVRRIVGVGLGFRSARFLSGLKDRI